MALTAEEIRKAQEAEKNRMAGMLATSDARAQWLKDRAQARTNAWHGELATARKEAADSIAQTALKDPGRYAPGVYDQARKERDQTGLRQHELDMIDRQGANGVNLQREKNAGAKTVAEIEAGAKNNETRSRYGYYDEKGNYIPGSELRVEQERGKTTLTKTEREIGAQTNIARLEHGWTDVDGVHHPGSRERVATITGESGVKQQAEIAKAAAAKAELDRQAQERNIAAQIQRASISAGAKIDAATTAAHSRIIGDAINAGITNGKDATTVLKELEEANKNNPALLSSIKLYEGQSGTQTGTGTPKEGDRRQTKEGWAVRRNGTWVLEK